MRWEYPFPQKNRILTESEKPELYPKAAGIISNCEKEKLQVCCLPGSLDLKLQLPKAATHKVGPLKGGSIVVLQEGEVWWGGRRS